MSRFILMVDSGSAEEPPNRRYGSLAAALRAFEALDPQWRPFAWIIESIQGANITHLRDGKLTDWEAT